MAWWSSKAAQIVSRLLLSACAVVLATFGLVVLVVGFDYARMHGDQRSLWAMGFLGLLLSLTMQRIWSVKGGWWQLLLLSVLVPATLALLWMLGVLPCSTRLNCPF